MGSVHRDRDAWRARWRDPSGRQRSKTFATKAEAKAHVAAVEVSLHQGTYLNPDGAKKRFGPYAQRWLSARNHELTTRARDASVMRVHVLPQWGRWPLGKIDHIAVQEWITELGRERSRSLVVEAMRLMSGVMRSAMRDRLIAINPCDGVQLPSKQKRDTDQQTIGQRAFVEELLPAVPARYQALVGLAGGAGLRWGECVGMRWDAVDLEHGEVQVVRVAVEVSGHVSHKPYPKSRAGRRTVPLPPHLVELLERHRELVEPGDLGELFLNRAGFLPKRTNFRVRVWRPSLARAGLLGKVAELGPERWLAVWFDRDGVERTEVVAQERDAVTAIARSSADGMHFHDLRHSYATWLVSAGVPVNDVRQVMGHEQASTTLNLYTHASPGSFERILAGLENTPSGRRQSFGAGDVG